MEFRDKIHRLAEKAAGLRQKGDVSEEQTKMALIVPMLQALGYDTSNPDEVCPEYNAAYGRHKDAKADYAILQNGKPAIIIECKSIAERNLEKHTSQLFGYFVATDAKFGILTNGVEYLFYSDIDEVNKMDESPFLSFSLESITDAQIIALEKFTKEQFSREQVRAEAEQLKYRKQVREYLEKEYQAADDDFTRYVLKETHAYSGKVLTQNIVDGSKKMIAEAFDYLIRNHSRKPRPSKIVTTEEERESFYIVRGMLAGVAPVGDITYKDTVSYFNILYKANTRQPICRLFLDGNKKRVGICNGQKNELGQNCFDYYDIDGPDDLYQYKGALVDSVRRYING